MSWPVAAAIGIILGALAGALHLAITRWRATLATTRGAAAAIATMPVGLVGLGLLVFVAARISPVAAWATPVGIVAVRLVVLGRSRR